MKMFSPWQRAFALRLGAAQERKPGYDGDASYHCTEGEPLNAKVAARSENPFRSITAFCFHDYPYR
jgi:hypothetical protein